MTDVSMFSESSALEFVDKDYENSHPKNGHISLEAGDSIQVS